MNNLTLREFANGGRFNRSVFKCPQCGGETLQDDWPPNYTHGSGSSDHYESWGHVKCVCLSCRIAFVMDYSNKWSNDIDQREHLEQAHNIAPLIERDGVLLTPHDVKREEYKEKHGEYPRESYG